MNGAPITWMSINLKNGGLRIDPADRLLRQFGTVDLTTLQRFSDVVRLGRHRPDVILMQEGAWFDRCGDELALYGERLLRNAGLGIYRSFVTRSLRNRHHQVVFIDAARLQPLHHWRRIDPDELASMYGFVEVIVDGDELRPLLLKSVHLNARDAEDRLAEAKRIHRAVSHGERALVAGDFNSITSRRTAEQGEPQRRFIEQHAADRSGKGIWPWTQPDGDTDPDTRAADYLIDHWWRDQHVADGNTTVTIRKGVDRGGELIIDRCLVYGAVATVPGSVWVDTSQVPYSDHRAFGGQVTIVDKDPAAPSP